MRTTHSDRSFSAKANAFEVGIDNALGHAIMVAQIDEEHAPVITNSVAPAGQTGHFAGQRFTQVAAGMRTVAMHYFGHKQEDRGLGDGLGG